MDVLSSPSDSGTPVSEWFRCCLPKTRREKYSSLKKPCENVILVQQQQQLTQPTRRELIVKDFAVSESSLSNYSTSSSGIGTSISNSNEPNNTPRVAGKAFDHNEEDCGGMSEPNTPTAVAMDDDDDDRKDSSPPFQKQQKQQPTTTLTKSLVHSTELVWHVFITVLSLHWLTHFLTGKPLPPPSSSSGNEPQQLESTTTMDEIPEITPTTNLPTPNPSYERRLTD